MPGFDHATKSVDEAASPRRTRLGLQLFCVYLALYVGFVLLNALAPERMANTPFAGVNLAVLYGLGLIVTAFVMALLYEVLCRRIDRQDAGQGGDAK
jgi:uncharacterized membrane protein (DUF485 family)